MLPLHTSKDHTSKGIPVNDIMGRFQRWLARHARHRASFLAACCLIVGSFYLLWPVTQHLQRTFFGSEDTRPDYSHNWPRERRAEAVKEAFTHAYSAYEQYAMPADELRPLKNISVQNFNGWGVSMFDALDTLWLLDMKAEFERAVGHVSRVRFTKTQKYDVMFFETVIRYLGGLLSAYSLSGQRILLDKADELGQRLLPAFGTETGMPAFAVNPDTHEIDLGPRHQDVVLAEIASCQMEYKYLSYLTGNPKYFKLSDRTMDWFENNQLNNGMWYTTWNVTTGEMSDRHLTIGALADSAYEYLLKGYLMSGRSEKRLRDMYIESMNGAIENLLYLSPTRQILYVTDVTTDSDSPNGVEPSRVFEHLSCFFPGLLALGAHMLADELPPETRALHAWAAEGLAYSCYLMYADSPIGLAPEEAVFERRDRGQLRPGGEWIPLPTDKGFPPLRRDDRWVDAVRDWQAQGAKGSPPGVPEHDTSEGVARPKPGASQDSKDYFALKRTYLLRPETIESLYVMWRTTGAEVWRDRAWEIFLAIETNCRMRNGYASIGVDRRDPSLVYPLDEMPSYALAETWKYLYLIFSDKDPIPMDQFVLNTEAHPFPIFSWSAKDKASFGLP